MSPTAGKGLALCFLDMVFSPVRELGSANDNGFFGILYEERHQKPLSGTNDFGMFQTGPGCPVFGFRGVNSFQASFLLGLARLTLR